MADMLKVMLEVHQARATARAAPSGDWVTAVEGREQVHIHVGGTNPIALRPSFRRVREDDRFRSTSAVATLDWQDPYAMKVADRSVAEPVFDHADYGRVIERFARLRSQGPSHSFAASRSLAGCPREYPDQAHRLVADIRADSSAITMTSGMLATTDSPRVLRGSDRLAGQCSARSTRSGGPRDPLSRRAGDVHLLQLIGRFLPASAL